MAALDKVWVSKDLRRELALAITLAALAFLARWCVDPWLHDRHEFLPSYLAVALATWFASWHAGVIVAAIGLTVLEFAFSGARNPSEYSALDNAAATVVYIFVSSLIIFLTQRAAAANRALAANVARLGEADHRKSDFLALLAHELRTPLSALTAGTGLIKTGALDANALRGTWEMMERQTDHMKRLVGDLLDVARLEQGKIELSREKVLVVPLVDDVIADLRGFTDARRQKVVHQIFGTPGAALLDCLRIGQVLSNLLHNASKFSAEETVITVTTRFTAEDVTVSVRDKGVGIPPSQLDEVFDSFVQLGSKAMQAQGLGLGLALTKKLVKMHGGSIQARSDGAGCGAEFVVQLPRGVPVETAAAVAAGGGQAAADSPDAASGPPALRLLIVDDNPDAADTLALLLRMMGHQATTANDGGSALRAAAQDQPDFIFLDIGLPDMSGHEVAVQLRRQVDGKQPVLVALTGWGGADDSERSRQAGFDSHLTKPVTLEQIDQALAIRRDPRCATPPPRPHHSRMHDSVTSPPASPDTSRSETPSA